VYQSSGVGRDREGRFMALGPAAVHRLDLVRGEATTLVEDERFDHLAPRVDAAGALWFIRRPYRTATAPGFLHTVLDVLLFPVRLIMALLAWINFFGVRYTGKPMITPRGARAREVDAKQWLLMGNVVDAARAAQGGDAGDDVPAQVPASWQLVRQSGRGAEEIVARGVAAFDLAGDGVVYSNGGAVYHVDSKGARTRLCTGSRIEQVIVLA
jgi:hypothetical protein